jgi:hypothetical protein
MTSTRTHTTTGRRPRRRILRPHHARVRRGTLQIGAHVARDETTTDGAW